MFHYCTTCVMPSTKPDLSFDENGVCNACQNFNHRVEINYDHRKQELNRILERYRSKDGSHWDCVIPVSGGKDSTFQVIKMLELGMNPLCVTATTCYGSELGKDNLESLKSLGVDLIEFTPNPKVRKKINRIGLTQVGDISWPEHVSIFTIPVRVAVEYKIPLIIWGENSQHEYGGPANATKSQHLDRRWLEEFGGLLGLRVSDLIGLEGLQKKDLLPYVYPPDEDLKNVGVTGLFLGYFLPWDGMTNFLVAQNTGWKAYHSPVEGGALSYENLDNLFHGIHDYFKFIKFGFGRATDHVCMQIRRERLSREEGFRIIRDRDGKFPWTYLGEPLEKILGHIGVSVDEFEKICDRFTNKKIFKKDSKGNLLKDENRNLKLVDPVPFRKSEGRSTSDQPARA